jgi:murein DD-endopeptidase MepM/ murein hydrolase activator NlpD
MRILFPVAVIVILIVVAGQLFSSSSSPDYTISVDAPNNSDFSIDLQSPMAAHPTTVPVKASTVVKVAIAPTTVSTFTPKTATPAPQKIPTQISNAKLLPFFQIFPAKGRISGTYYQAYSQNGVEPNHSGLDIINSCGSAIVSAGTGTVILVQQNWNEPKWIDSYYPGWVIAILHGYMSDGKPYITFYMHLNSTNVSLNEKVTSGQKIGTMGSTKNGCHLHWAASNILPNEFPTWNWHASEHGGSGWIDPAKPPSKLTIK